MGGTGRRGLGRGLGAIISALPEGVAFPLSGDAGSPARGGDAAGLDELGSALHLDLCAYLHVGDGDGPRLRVRGDAVDPAAALDLSSALARFVGSTRREPVLLHVAGFVLLVVVSEGPRSRGVHALGRRDRALDDVETRVALRLCRSIAESIHGVDPVGLVVGRAS